MTHSDPATPNPPRRLALTHKDLEIFHWLWMLRVLSLGQLRRLCYYQPENDRLSSLHNVRKRLRRLWKAGYLDGDMLARSRQRIYFLAEPALPSLASRYGVAQRRLYKLRGLESLRQVHHALLVSECAVRVVESVRGSSLKVVNLPPLSIPFYNTHAVGAPRKRRHVDRFVTQEDLRVPGRSGALRLRPDLVFALRGDDISRLYFLEADRGSEGPHRLAEKLLAYHHLRKDTDPLDLSRFRWQRYGAVRDFRVLLVTTSPRRVAALTAALVEKPGFGLVSIATAEQVKEENMVFAPIWANCRGTGRSLARQQEQPSELAASGASMAGR